MREQPRAGRFRQIGAHHHAHAGRAQGNKALGTVTPPPVPAPAARAAIPSNAPAPAPPDSRRTPRRPSARDRHADRPVPVARGSAPPAAMPGALVARAGPGAGGESPRPGRRSNASATVSPRCTRIARVQRPGRVRSRQRRHAAPVDREPGTHPRREPDGRRRQHEAHAQRVELDRAGAALRVRRPSPRRRLRGAPASPPRARQAATAKAACRASRRSSRPALQVDTDGDIGRAHNAGRIEDGPFRRPGERIERRRRRRAASRATTTAHSGTVMPPSPWRRAPPTAWSRRATHARLRTSRIQSSVPRGHRRPPCRPQGRHASSASTTTPCGPHGP